MRTKILNLYGAPGAFGTAIVLVVLAGLFFLPGYAVVRGISGEAPKNWTLVALAIFSMLPAIFMEWFILSQFRPRTHAMRGESKRIGFRFFKDLNEFNDERLEEKLGLCVCHDFKFFEEGPRRFFNVLYGENHGVKFLVFDLEIEEGIGQDAVKYWQTVCHVESDRLRLPIFQMRPESLRDKAKALAGWKDINFDSHPAFSRMYSLKGADDAAIRSRFSRGLLEHLAKLSGLWLEAKAGISCCAALEN